MPTEKELGYFTIWLTGPTKNRGLKCICCVIYYVIGL